jgi:hypothetical protein
MKPYHRHPHTPHPSLAILGLYALQLSGLYNVWDIAGYRHRHSGILFLSPAPEYSGTRLGPFIPVPDWFRHRHFCSFQYRTDWMPDSPTFRHLKKGYTLHVYTASVGGGERDNHAVHDQTSDSEKFKSDLPCKMWIKKILNEGNQIHNISSSGSLL